MEVKRVFKLLWIYKKTLFVVLVPFVFLPLPLVTNSQEAKCGYVLIIMALYWTTEVLPLSVTALLPMIFLPLLGVMKAGDVAIQYFKDTNMMMLGGLTVALAIEKCNLHRRIALGVLRLVGAKPQWLMIGFMLPTWFLSMWISNTATTAMMIPVVEAVLHELEDTKDKVIPGLDTSPPDDLSKPKSTVHSIGVQNKSYTENEVDNSPAPIANGDIGLHVIGDKHSKENGKIFPVTIDGSLSTIPGEPKKNNLDLEAHRSSSDSSGDQDSDFREMCKGFTLCICYAANAGGTATLTGTGPNLVLKGQVDEIWESKGVPSPINFSTWVIFGFPGAVILLIITWIWLMFFFLGWRNVMHCCSKDGDPEKEAAVKGVIRRQYKNLGPLRFDEMAVGGFFVLLVLLWFFRQPEFMPGWSSFFRKGYTADAIPALLIAVILYFFPSRLPWKLGNETDAHGAAPALMDWKHFQSNMPWGIILLLGGGFALAKASQESGLSDLIADKLSVFRHLPGFVLVFILCFMVAMLTEVTSNSATATILLPIMAALAESIGKNPLYLMLPVAVSTSFAYMLPVATPPNAIAFSYGRIRVIDMVKAGAILNVIAVIVVTIGTHTWGMAFFHFDTMPWDTSPANTTLSALMTTQSL